LEALRSKFTKPMWDEIRELLGDHYGAYGDYERTSSYRSSLGDMFSHFSVPLTDPQIDLLVPMIVQHTQYVRARPSDISTQAVTDWSAVAHDADELLTPAQLAILRKLSNGPPPDKKPAS
jgi:hypothetical protein